MPYTMASKLGVISPEFFVLADPKLISLASPHALCAVLFSPLLLAALYAPLVCGGTRDSQLIFYDLKCPQKCPEICRLFRNKVTSLRDHMDKITVWTNTYYFWTNTYLPYISKDVVRCFSKWNKLVKKQRNI